MNTRTDVWLWMAQRASAAVLAVAVGVHILTLIVASGGGLSTAEIAGRVQGSVPWLGFYLTFVAAIAVHAPIGVRAVLRESQLLPEREADAVCLLLALALFVAGARAAFAVFAMGH